MEKDILNYSPIVMFHGTPCKLEVSLMNLVENITRDPA